MSPSKLLNRLNAKPFRPFRAILSNGSRIDVLFQPGSVVVGPTAAVVPLTYGQTAYGSRIVERWKTVELDQIVELVELET